MALAISLLTLSQATAAQAHQFKKLVQIGQTIPGNNQPVTEIIQPTIGEGGLVAVVLRTKPVMNAPGAPTPRVIKPGFGGAQPSTPDFAG